MKVYANQNETVDALCWRHLGVTEGVVERTLELNPGLVNVGVALKQGTPVILPNMPDIKHTKKMVQLWD